MTRSWSTRPSRWPVGPAAITAEDAEAIAKEATIWGYPMVMNYKTLYSYVIDTGGPEYKGPFNEIACEARLFTPEDRAVVTPNADTPYCMFWLDLRAEPMVLTVLENGDLYLNAGGEQEDTGVDLHALHRDKGNGENLHGPTERSNPEHRRENPRGPAQNRQHQALGHQPRFLRGAAAPLQHSNPEHQRIALQSVTITRYFTWAYDVSSSNE